MKFAISLPCTGPLATGPAALDSLRIVAQKAEALGLESIWVPDHVVIPTTVNSRYPYNKSGKFSPTARDGLFRADDGTGISGLE